MENYDSVIGELSNALKEYYSQDRGNGSYHILFAPLQKASKFLISEGIFIFLKTKKECKITENENPSDYLRNLKLPSEEARDIIWKDNLGLVKEIVKKYYSEFSPKLEYGDVESEGIFGLLKAIKNYDINRGFLFPPYALPVIKHHIGRNLYKYLRRRKLQTNFSAYSKKFEHFLNSFKKKFNHPPSDEELADFMGESVNHVKNIRAYEKGLYNLSSLNSPIFDEEEGEISDNIIDENSFFEEKILDDITNKITLSEFLKKNIPKLSSKEKLVALERLKDKTLEEIAFRAGETNRMVGQSEKIYTKEGIRGIESRVMKKWGISKPI